MNVVLEKTKNWIKDNCLVLVYFVLAIAIELTAVGVVEGIPFITRPFVALGLLIFLCGIVLLVKNNYARTVICTVALAGQVVLTIVFSVIFDMTDQYFDWGMLYLRNDAFAILENVPVNFVIFFVGFALTVFYVIFGLRFAYHTNHELPPRKRPKKSIFFYIGVMAAGIATLGTSYYCYYPQNANERYENMINGKTGSAYASYGMIGNLLGQVGQEVFQDRTPLPDEQINEYIYAKTSQASEETDWWYGAAAGKNVLTVLGESLEWYTFLRGDDEALSFAGEYPHKLDIPQDTLAELYPNLTAFYNESVVMTNFHGREKTDIAETISIVGSYPTRKYINYEYDDNDILQTVPNILNLQENGEVYTPTQQKNGKFVSRSFHNGFKTFYNRDGAHPALGFESGVYNPKDGHSYGNCPIDMYNLEDMSDRAEDRGEEGTFTEYMDKGERNLDSEMVTTAGHLMFPTDKRFYTYITTITMHGRYSDRKNLQKENNTKLADKIVELEKYFIDDGDDTEHESVEQLYYYMKAGLEFDYMLGCLREELQNTVYPVGHEKEGETLWDNTIIVLFGDHNAYYEKLSNYVKGIEDEDDDEKFTDLYNVPLMIHDVDLNERVQAEANRTEVELNEVRIIDKFTCTADIVPTLFDLLGIKYYTNLYYGHSVFSAEQSVLYSRAYDIFMSDGILRRSVKGKFYQYKGDTETGVPVANTVAAFEAEGTLLVEKIKYCDYIFKQDHFGDKMNKKTFVEKMQELNGWKKASA